MRHRGLLGTASSFAEKSAFCWEGSSQALTDYLDLPLIRHSHLPLLERILQLKENFTAYNATYVSLAEMLQAPLVTADDSLARAVKGLVPDTGPPPL